MKTGFVVSLLAIAMLGASSLAQEDTANDWLKKGYELMANGSYEEAAKAMQKSIDLSPSPTNATLWDAKAQSLALAAVLIGNRSEYNESLKAEDKAIELDPKNSTFLVNKGFSHRQYGRCVRISKREHVRGRCQGVRQGPPARPSEQRMPGTGRAWFSIPV
jgi:tetratricopeptide (TPR) repeat protein